MKKNPKSNDEFDTRWLDLNYTDAYNLFILYLLQKSSNESHQSLYLADDEEPFSVIYVQSYSSTRVERNDDKDNKCNILYFNFFFRIIYVMQRMLLNGSIGVHQR